MTFLKKKTKHKCKYKAQNYRLPNDVIYKRGTTRYWDRGTDPALGEALSFAQIH